MPLVTESIDINGSRKAVYRQAADMESFSQFMPDVKSVTVLQREGNETMTEWKTLLQGRPFVWKERDLFYPDEYRIAYSLVEGDLKKFEGEWTVQEANGATRLTLTVDFEFGVPMIAAMLNPIAKLAVSKNCKQMLQAIKKAVEGQEGQ